MTDSAASYGQQPEMRRAFTVAALDSELPSGVLEEIYEQTNGGVRPPLPDSDRLRSRLEREVEMCRRWPRPLGFLLAKIGTIDEIERALGAGAVDRALHDVGLRITESVRATDLVGRWSAHELALILPGAFADGVNAVAGRLSKVFENRPIYVSGEDSSLAMIVGVKLGGAAWEQQMTGAEDLVKGATSALLSGVAVSDLSRLADAL